MANTADIVIAETEVTDTLYQGRFNCSQCHAPQSKTKTAVANTFTPDFENSSYKGHSSLAEAMNTGAIARGHGQQRVIPRETGHTPLRELVKLNKKT